jgi:hypothetical protein
MRGVNSFFRLLMSPVSSALNTSSAAWVPERAPSQISAFGSFSRTKRWKIWSSLEEALPAGGISWAVVEPNRGSSIAYQLQPTPRVH